jgi:deoxyadenosine/deoxycytidine kinase
MNANYKIISIEGNIGSGKSTLLESLRKKYEDDTHVIFLREPVDDWEKIKDKEGINMLKKFYLDQEKYSFAFQMMAYISRLKILRDTIKEIKKTKNPEEKFIIITERSLYTDKHIFAKMLYDQGKIEDVCYQIYLNWFDEFASDFDIKNTIYVNTEPKKCYERIHKRSREGEEVIPLNYLESCHNYHNEFLDIIKTEKLEIDGNIDIYKNREVLDQWLEEIKLMIEV